MKVGTDGVLLGAWVQLSNEKKILDVGTGTGLIALMMAQRCDAFIDALEIDQKAAAQALKNINGSPWHSRIDIHHTSLQNFNKKNNYDLMISNPPYFSNSLKNPDKTKSKARHTESLNMDDLLIAGDKLLNRKGKLAVILPVNEGKKFIQKAEERKFHCIRKTNVKPKPGKNTIRCLMEFSKINMPLTEDSITIENNKRHDYTNEYINLTKEFYLNF